MHIEFLVEEPSAEAALTILIPKIVGEAAIFDIHVHQGKRDLLAKLPGRLKGYKAWMPDDMRIVVLIDRDSEDCSHLKAKLESIAKDAGLITKSSAGGTKNFHILNRLAIEELEAWFFGDPEAIVAAYPGISRTLTKRARFRDPDAISGGTWESLERELKKAGHHLGGLMKITAAHEISEHMDPQRNISRSFQVFYNSLLEMTQ